MKKLLLFLYAISLYATTNIVVSYENKATYPYYTKPNSKQLGLAIDALKSIEKKLDVKFIFVREPGVRGLKKLAVNKVDLLLFASYNKDRDKIAVYPKKNGVIDSSKKSMELGYYLYTLKDSNLSWNGKEFLNLNGKIGTTRGYSIIKFLRKLNIDISESNSNEIDILKLLKHRVVGVVNQSSKIDLYLKKHPEIALKIKKVYPAIQKKPYYIIVSKKFYKNHKKLAIQIWELMKNLDTNPNYKKLREKY